MKSSASRLAVFLPLFWAGGVNGETHPRSLTLDETIALAMKESSAVLKADVDSDVRGEQLIQSYLQWLPNLSAQANYNSSRGKLFVATAAPTLIDGSSYGSNYQISTVLNLFNGLSDLSNYRSIKDKKLAADKTFERAKEQVALDVAQSFLQVILDAKLVSIAEANFKISQDRTKLLEAQSQVGARSLADFFRQQAQTSADESSLISVKNRLETDKIVLLKKLRMDPRETVSFVEPLLAQDVKAPQNLAIRDQEIAHLTEEALKRRADYDASQRIAEATQEDVNVARAPYLPRLDFVATYGALSRKFDFQRVNGVDVAPAEEDSLGEQLQDHANYTYGLALTWNIFDRGVTRSTVSVARGIAYKAKIDSEDYRNQVIGEVKQMINDRDAAVQQMQTSQVGLRAAQKAFEVSSGRYEVGALSFIDLSAAQIALFQAQTNFAQATISYELQKRAMVYVLGTDAALVPQSP
jgi:outer membrane protein